MDARKTLLVAIGGVVGSAARWATGDTVGSALWSLVIVNVIGAFLLGVLVRIRHVNDTMRLWLGVGFCGALTTFSTLAVDIARRLDTGDPRAAASFATTTIGLGLGAAICGGILGGRLEREP